MLGIYFRGHTIQFNIFFNFFQFNNIYFLISLLKMTISGLAILFSWSKFGWRLHDEKKKRVSWNFHQLSTTAFNDRTSNLFTLAFFEYVWFTRTSPFVASSAFLKACSAGGGELRTWGCGWRLLQGSSRGEPERKRGLDVGGRKTRRKLHSRFWNASAEL